MEPTDRSRARPAPRILVVSGSAGNGHTMAGRALTTAFRLHPAAVDVAHVDALDHMLGAYSRVYRSGYVRLVDKHPLLWRRVYELTEQGVPPITGALTRFAGRPLVRYCRDWRPDAVVCTHFLAPEILTAALGRGRLDTQVHIVVTDHDMHGAWFWPHVARYYVASELVKARLALGFGMAEARVQVTGLPIRPEFAQQPDTAALRARLGLDTQRPVVLFLSGGFAAGPMARSIHGIWLERRDTQVIAVCGRNERLRRRVARLARPSGAVLHALGFVQEVAPLMALADLVVAKSGGLTVAECMAMGRPLVISGSIPGQEERNADFVVEAGAGVRALSPVEVRWRVGRLLADAQRRAAMAAAARAVGTPHAAQHVVEAVLGDLRVASPPPGPYFHGARPAAR